jgi:DNA-binding NarL/FixJ family response regulator
LPKNGGIWRAPTATEVIVVSLLVVDRSQFMVDTMSGILTGRPEVRVVGVTTDVEDALKRVSECSTLVVSAALPNRGALNLIKRAKKANPKVKIIVMDLSRASDPVDEYTRTGATLVFEEDTLASLLDMAQAA